MSKKVVNKKAAVKKTASAESEFVHPKVWSYIRFFYDQNKQLWQRCAQYEKDLAEIKSQLREVA